MIELFILSLIVAKDCSIGWWRDFEEARKRALLLVEISFYFMPSWWLFQKSDRTNEPLLMLGNKYTVFLLNKRFFPVVLYFNRCLIKMGLMWDPFVVKWNKWFMNIYLSFSHENVCLCSQFVKYSITTISYIIFAIGNRLCRVQTPQPLLPSYFLFSTKRLLHEPWLHSRLNLNKWFILLVNR